MFFNPFQYGERGTSTPKVVQAWAQTGASHPVWILCSCLNSFHQKKNLSFIKTKIYESINRNLEIHSTLKMAVPNDWFCRQKTEDSVTSCQNDQRGERVPSKYTGQPLPGEFHATNKRANIITRSLEERAAKRGETWLGAEGC